MTDSVSKSITVDADPARAFALFASRMGSWWPRSYSISPSPIADVVVEPRAGGRWYERSEDGSECQWGQVLVWDPPHRLVLAWQVSGEWAYDAELMTEVELRFTDAGSGRTRVDLEHRGLDAYGAGAEAMRAELESPNGWSTVLQHFADVANAGSAEAA